MPAHRRDGSAAAVQPPTLALVAEGRPSGRPPARDMVWVPGGTFAMGSDHHYPEEAPAHPVAVAGFWMDRAPVTNAQFRRFVKETGYRTVAERPADPALYGGTPDPQALAPASIVFVPPAFDPGLGPGAAHLPQPARHYAWWHYIAGADWRHPEGPGSSIRQRDKHPVVHIAWEDALAYAHWCGKQLPTEVEWERAAWGGRSGSEYAWGDDLHPQGQAMANTFQGAFPHHNSRWDGYERTSPVGAFPANGFGLVDMIGNVWEWTSSWYGAHPAVGSTAGMAEVAAEGCCAGAAELAERLAREASIDRQSQHGAVPRKVMKGGSYLCAPEYCRRYRPAARMAQGVDTSTGHLGFRCVIRPDPA